MKNFLIPVLIIIALFGFYKLTSKNTNITSAADSSADLILFWGDGCPHCEVVKEYISKNKIDSKVKISLKEVYYNKTNQSILETTIKQCPEIDTKQGVGVPLAFDTKNKKCLLGDQPIIDWLSQK